MQKPQAECDLLKCSGRDRADEHAIGQRAIEARNIDAASSAGIECAMRKRGNRDARAHRFERTDDAARMPFAAPFLDEEREMESAPIP